MRFISSSNIYKYLQFNPNRDKLQIKTGIYSFIILFTSYLCNLYLVLLIVIDNYSLSYIIPCQKQYSAYINYSPVTYVNFTNITSVTI